MQIPREHSSRPAIIVGTGPSLLRIGTPSAVLRRARELGAVIFGVNNADEFGLDYHVTVNPEWWQFYYGERRPDGLTVHWHSDERTAEHYGINHFNWFHVKRNDAGLSRDPNQVHMGHSSGFATLNIAYLYGCDPLILVGHDLRFPAGYDAQAHKPGGDRHYFGEYPTPLQRWPSVKVRDTGELDGLLVCYEYIPQTNPDVTIINCSPGSALTCFPFMDLEEALENSDYLKGGQT